MGEYELSYCVGLNSKRSVNTCEQSRGALQEAR
jgi:hypothetical protein